MKKNAEKNRDDKETKVEKQELIQRSPVRIFEKSIHGGLKAGEIGVIASQSGIGKTSVLVQIALDKLLQTKKVVHVSFNQHTDYVLSWYEDIFDEFVSKKNLENARDVRNELTKNRVLMNFSQDGVPGDQILQGLKAMIVDGGFKAEAIIIDGFDFAKTDRERIIKVKEFAKLQGIELWYSCTVSSSGQSYDKHKFPLVIKDYTDLIDVVIVLEPKPDHIELTVPKDRTLINPEHMALKLDPKTLLILAE
jgi:KaiC/GvpD/RAD55 family RecA-like ATPase